MLMMRMLTTEVLVIMIVRMHRLLSSFLRVLGVSPKAEVTSRKIEEPPLEKCKSQPWDLKTSSCPNAIGLPYS